MMFFVDYIQANNAVKENQVRTRCYIVLDFSDWVILITEFSACKIWNYLIKNDLIQGVTSTIIVISADVIVNNQPDLTRIRIYFTNCPIRMNSCEVNLATFMKNKTEPLTPMSLGSMQIVSKFTNVVV